MVTVEQRYEDKNGTILKMNDWIKDKKGNIAQLRNIRGVAVVLYKHRGIVLSKVDTTETEKLDVGGYEE